MTKSIIQFWKDIDKYLFDIWCYSDPSFIPWDGKPRYSKAAGQVAIVLSFLWTIELIFLAPLWIPVLLILNIFEIPRRFIRGIKDMNKPIKDTDESL